MYHLWSDMQSTYFGLRIPTSTHGFRGQFAGGGFPLWRLHRGIRAQGQANGRPGRKVLDGAYATMTARLAARNKPSLMVMSYDGGRSRVTDLIVVPRHFFVQSIIEPKTPTWLRGRSAPWQGCNILIGL